MAKKTTKVFSKGMNKDIARIAVSPDTYLDCYNLSLAVDDSGESRSSLITPKGTTLKFAVPTIYASYKIELTATGAGKSITINGDTVTQTVTSGTPIKEYYDQFLSKPGYNVSYKLAYNKEYLVVVGITTNPTIVVSAGITSTQLTPQILTPLIVGATVVKNDLIIFTAAASGQNELGIWKTTYNESNLTLPLTVANNLLYIKDLDYSLNYTIKAKARVENDYYYRLYWTDNNTPIKSINLFDDQVLATQPELLEIQPKVELGKPEINDIVNGSLMSGVREYYIRYSTRKGKRSLFSPASNIVQLGKSKDSKGEIVNFEGSESTPENTGKGIKIRVSNVDLSYDFIELICVYRESLDGATTIEVVRKEEIYQTAISGGSIVGTLYLIHSGTEETTSLTESEIASLGNILTHCRDIEEKEDRLFFANIREEIPDLTFDARAYRFRSNVDPAGAQQAVLVGKTGNITLTNPNPAYSSVPETHDCINDYNDENPDTNANWSTNDQFKYQADGVTLGGSGTNISYTFTTLQTDAENAYATAKSQVPWYSVTKQAAATTLTVGNEVIDIGGEWKSIANPKLTKLRGYCRGEIYRFGIVLYDLKGRPGYVNWIGDIKFPETSESSTYLLGATSGAEYKLNNLGIQFSISIPTALRSLITGYAIVRMERSEVDKTRVMMGMLGQPWLADLTTVSLTQPCDFVAYIDGKLASHNNTANRFPDTASPHTGFNALYNFDSPDLVNKENRDEIDCDAIKTNAKMATLINTAATRDYPASGNTQSYRILKYDNSALSGTAVTRNVKRAEVIGEGETTYLGKFIASGGTTFDQLKFINYGAVTDLVGTLYSIGDGAGGYEYTVGVGCKTMLISIDDGTIINFNTLVGETGAGDFSAASDHRKIYCALIKYLSAQYGGNTYEVRSTCEYIACSEFRKITSATTYPTTENVFGGDVYLSFYDFTKLGRMTTQDVATSKNIIVDYPTPSSPTYSAHVVYPVESTINPYFRNGLHFANNNEIEVNVNIASRDTFTYNNVYHQEANMIKFFAEPVDFNSITNYPNRIAYSDSKIDGEEIDSWSIVGTNNYKDLESNKGDLTGLINFKQDLYFIQQRAFGRLLVNAMSLIQDTTNTQLLLGTGDVLQKPQYISTDYGSSHTFSIAKSDNGIYFFDSLKRRFVKFGQDIGTRQISVIDGLHAYTNNDLPYNQMEFDNPTNRGGITSEFDYMRNEMIFAFNYRGIAAPTGKTIIYNEDTNSFTGFYDFIPSLLITLNKHLLSVDASNRYNLYEHNVGNYLEFYGTKKNAKLSFVINENPTITKMFNHLCLHQKATKYGAGEDMKQTFTKIRCYTDHQNSDYKTIILKPTSNYNATIVDREVRLAIPRNAVIQSLSNPDIFNAANINQSQTFKEPMRDKYIVVELWFEPTSDNTELRLDFVDVYYDISYR